MIHIRLLTENDVNSFEVLRARGLRESPEAFGATIEEFQQDSRDKHRERLRIEGNPPERFVLGAFDEQETLVGMAGIYREKYSKIQHKAWIWGMYVAPETRGQGVAKLLLQDLIKRSTSIPGLEQIHLSVVTTNEAARRLYLKLGFRVYGLEPHALKQGERYLDEEHMLLSLVR